MAGLGSYDPQALDKERASWPVPSMWFLADILEAAESGQQPLGSIQDPVTWAYLLATCDPLRRGPNTLGNRFEPTHRFLELIQKQIPSPGMRRSCLELRRFSFIRSRIRDQARIAWQLAGRFPTIKQNALWNASVLSSLGWVLLVNNDGTKASSLDSQTHDLGGGAEHSELFQQASSLARDFCLNLNLPDWCLLWTTRMGWPATAASLEGGPALDWHLARIASFLEARDRPTLNGVNSRGYADSCKLVGMDPWGPWRDGILQRADEACPDPEAHSGDYPEPDPRWIRIAIRQAAARTSDSGRLISAHLAHERDLAIRSMEAMHLELSNLAFEQVMAGMAEFTAGAGHEINNPLAIIQGRARQLHRSADALVKKSGLSEFRSRLEDIQEQCRRLHALLKKLMRFARPGSPVLAPIEVPEMVERLAVICRNDLGTIPFDSPIPADWNSVPIQMTDFAFLRDAWTELSRNAAFAATETGTVSMRVDFSSGGQLILRLSNSGPAIPDDLKRNLFTPFFSSRQAGRAPGLGLPLAWRLLDSIGAKLTLESDGKDHPVCWKVEMPKRNGAALSMDEAATARKAA